VAGFLSQLLSQWFGGNISEKNFKNDCGAQLYITYCTLTQLYAILQDIHSVYRNSQGYFVAHVRAKILILTSQRFFFLGCDHDCAAARLDRLKSLTY
jgi:hypothetical protein